jgi:hypothetical protein
LRPTKKLARKARDSHATSGSVLDAVTITQGLPSLGFRSGEFWLGNKVVQLTRLDASVQQTQVTIYFGELSVRTVHDDEKIGALRDTNSMMRCHH